MHALQNTLKALDQAFLRFFKKSGGYPKFKRYGDPIGVRETDVACFAVDSANGRAKLPKIGWLRYRKSREVTGTPKIVTVSHALDGWSVSIMAESVRAIPCAATDTGRRVAPLDAHKHALHRLKKYQRAVVRKIEAANVA